MERADSTTEREESASGDISTELYTHIATSGYTHVEIFAKM
jgi:hypothetical protein